MGGGPGGGAVRSVLCAGKPLLDLDYEEDFGAEEDLNVVGNAAGELLEVQGTAEKRPFTPAQLTAMVELAQKGLRELHQQQTPAPQEAFVKKISRARRPPDSVTREP